jgi:FAD:protein FMN transferase
MNRDTRGDRRPFLARRRALRLALLGSGLVAIWLAHEGRAQAQGGAASSSVVSAATSDAFELLIKFEINGPEGSSRRYRRPYLAIWLEDKDGHTVRTILLWVQTGERGSRWIPELRRWHQNDRARRRTDATDRVTTTARPTRPPGKYDVIWDGKDDNGRPLEPGPYTLFIEASREHGTYQIIRKPIDVGEKPFTEELKGNAEIKAVSIEYRKRPNAITGAPLP